MEIRWSKSSLRRLEEIGKFIALDSPSNAIKFINKLIVSIERLRKFPLSGGLVAENPAFRQVVIKDYRIVYRIREKQIEVVTVISPGLNQKC